MKLLVLIISLFFCSITNAATYYISPAGNDATGNGSITNPWKTLKKATSTVTSAGNIIFVTAGTYIESSTSTLAPGVSIEGTGTTSIIKASFSTVFQMIIEAHSTEGTNGNQHISNISMDGQNSTSWAIQIQGRSNFSIHDCTIYNFAQRGIVWGGRDDNGDAPPTIYATGNKFYNNTVTNCASFDGTYGYGCLNIGGQDGMLIYNNSIVTTGNMPGWPIKLWNEGHIKGCKIYNNTLKRPPFPYQYNGIGNYFDFCIEMFYEQGLEIYNNIIEGSVDLNYQTKGAYAYSAYIHDNVFGRTTQAAHCETGIWLEFQTEGLIIENNSFKNISQPIMFSLRPGSFMNDITIQKNLAFNIGKTDGTREGAAIGIIVNDNSTNYSAANWFVYNNTFLALPGANAPYFGVNIPGGNTSTNIKLINNIISDFNYYGVSCDYGSHVNGLIVRNNTKYNNGSNNAILFSNGNPTNYTNTGNLTSNPVLDANYIPVVGSSPCIDAGINVGLPYNGSAPEIGFFEIGVTNVPPTANAGPDQAITLPTDSVRLNGSGNDPDGNITAYQWTKISGPVAGSITSPNLASTAVTGLAQGVYKFELRVTDNGGSTGRDTMQVTVNAAPNIPPTADAGPDQTITLPTNSVALNGSGNDPDGSIASYQWRKISGPACTITNPNSASTTVTGMLQGTYRFELKVTDNNGAVGRDTMQVTVNPNPNIPPTANAGPDQTITLPTNSVALNGSGNDPDGNIAAYLWTKISGPACTITNPNSASTTVTGMLQGNYRFELKVTDNNGAIGRDTMQVTVNPDPNIPPTANAGPDQTITLPTNSVALNGSGNDPDGNIAAYLWTKISGPACTITNPNSASTTVTGMLQGTYRFELKVTDNNGAIGRDTMQVTVNAAPNIPPTANAGPDQTITLPTNSVALNGSGNDPDGNIAAYLWTKISGPACTITDPNSASTTVTGMLQGTYRFELKVTDNNGAVGRDTMQVTVNPDPNIPPTANAGPDQLITLPLNTITLNGTGNDPDGNIAAYLWTKISGPACTITNPNSASTTVTGMLQGTYRFELKVTDNNGAIGRDTMQVTVNPQPNNIPPTANAGSNQTITLPINIVTLTGSGNDPDGNIIAYTWSKISGPAAGTISNPGNANTAVTGLVQGVYIFELKVTDDGGAIGRDSIQVTVNAAPNIPPTANAGSNQTITLPTNSVTLSGSGNDPDGSIAAYQWTKISGPVCTITNSNSALTTVTGMLQGTYLFELRVTDNSGAFGRDTVQITVNAEPNNIPPTANAGPDKTVTLPDNSATLSGSGNDADGVITRYDWRQLSGPSNNVLFSLVNAVTYINNLIHGEYEFELMVTDNRGATAIDTVKVTVTGPPQLIPLQNTIKIFPNPVIAITTLDVKSTKINTPISITIYDLQGKIVFNKFIVSGQNNFSEKIDLRNLLKGTYMVSVIFDKTEKQTLAIVKM